LFYAPLPISGTPEPDLRFLGTFRTENCRSVVIFCLMILYSISETPRNIIVVAENVPPNVNRFFSRPRTFHREWISWKFSEKQKRETGREKSIYAIWLKYNMKFNFKARGQVTTRYISLNNFSTTVFGRYSNATL